MKKFICFSIWLSAITTFLLTALSSEATASAPSSRLTGAQNASIANLAASKLKVAEKFLVIENVARTIVFLGETHVMTASSGAVVDSVLKNFKFRAVEGDHCEGYICEGLGFIIMRLYEIMSRFGSASSIEKADLVGWTINSIGEVGYNNYLIGRIEGDHFRITQGLIASMLPEEGAELARFLNGVRHYQLQLDPGFINPSEFDDSPQDFPFQVRFNKDTPINIEIEFGHAKRFKNCAANDWFVSTRNCRMAANIKALLTEFSNIQVLLVQTGDAHTNGVMNLLK